MSLLDRITIDPEICFGKPCIRGMRWPVTVVLDILGSEMTIPEILEDPLKNAIAERINGIFKANTLNVIKLTI
jgi:Protein of unknown function (DUF433)